MIIINLLIRIYNLLLAGHTVLPRAMSGEENVSAGSVKFRIAESPKATVNRVNPNESVAN